MKSRFPRYSLFAIIVMALVLLTTATVSAGSPQNGPSANGHAVEVTDDYRETTTFHAREKKNGDVTGSLLINYLQEGYQGNAWGDIDCLRIVDDNTAYMSGEVTRASDGFGLVAGDPFWFMVIDNGEGANDPVDQGTYVYFDALPHRDDWNDCTEDVPFDELDSVEIFDHPGSGNFQVKP